MIHALSIRKFENFFFPRGRLGVVDDVRGTEGFREVELGFAARGGDDGGAEGGRDLVMC
jgi:hypothetical protein